MIALSQILQALLFPTGLVFALLLVSMLARGRRRWSCGCIVAAILVLFVAGNGWVANTLMQSLERRYTLPNPLPTADMIVVLAGGKCPQFRSNHPVDPGEGGDRLAYGDYLFRMGKAPAILCTGGTGAGDVSGRAAAEEMKAFYQMRGIPDDAIIVEDKARNTREHPMYCVPILRERKVKRILLVTSASHMPRSVAVFHRFDPELEIIPAPTDFQSAEINKQTVIWTVIRLLVPKSDSLDLTTTALHEYVGIAYYTVRGWM